DLVLTRYLRAQADAGSNQGRERLRMVRQARGDEMPAELRRDLDRVLPGRSIAPEPFHWPNMPRKTHSRQRLDPSGGAVEPAYERCRAAESPRPAASDTANSTTV